MYRNILIATDGSELASKAVDHGVMLAKGIGASVIFVTVTEIWSAMELAAEAIDKRISNPMERYEEMAAKSAQKILSAAKTAADGAGIEWETIHVRDRAPAEGIIATANERGCDLIVMASHGRRGLDRLVLGSQTVEVLSYSKVPVLVLR
jgi:nucleotide-binding universal stress UspA family protein